MFDGIAERYDFLNHLLSAGIDRRWRRRAIRSLELTGRETVLDLCTGTADLAIAAAEGDVGDVGDVGADRAVGARRVVGVDFAGEMLRVGLEKLRRRPTRGRVTLVRGDATRIPAADASVDAVTIGFGIRNVEDTDAACREIARVLVANGRLAILEFALPTAPVVRPLYLWYFRRVLPIVGRLISRDRGAYGYLPASVGSFAAPDEFVKILRQSGFERISAVPLTFGIVFLYTARRMGAREAQPPTV
jgi:demethylmenaquinone methyltransferase / 2-methoxy-6-polyprenyl-1,4-benzoquinol methylase